jgi:hypothetical protein
MYGVVSKENKTLKSKITILEQESLEQDATISTLKQNEKELSSVSNIIKTKNENAGLIEENKLLLRKIEYLKNENSKLKVIQPKYIQEQEQEQVQEQVEEQEQEQVEEQEQEQVEEQEMEYKIK